MTVYEAARANMIESQLRPNKVTDERVIAAFAQLRRELEQRLQCARRAGADTGFHPMADADECDDGGGFHEIEMAAAPTQ